MATPLYVNPAAANDLGDGTTPATAKKTVDAAYTAVDDGGSVYLLAGTYDTTTQGPGWYLNIDIAKSVLFKPDPATFPAITLSTAGATFGVLFATGNADDTITIEGVTIAPTTGTRMFSLGGSFDGHAKFVGCTLTAGSRDVSFTANTPVLRNLTLDGCTITTSADSFLNGCLDVDNVVMTNCTVTATSASSGSNVGVIELLGRCNRVVMSENTVSLGASLFNAGATSINESTVIKGNTVTWTPNGSNRLIYFRDDATSLGRIHIEGNSIDVALTAFAPTVITIGFSSDYSTAPKAYHPVITKNMITHARSGYGTGISLSAGCENAHVTYNDIRGFECDVMMNGTFGVSVDTNYLEGGGEVLMPYGGGRHTITHNNIKAFDYGGGAVVGRCVLFNRLIKATSTATTTFTGTTVTDTGGVPWGGDQADITSAIANGLVALCNAETPAWWEPTHWGRVVSILGNEVTVDAWYKYDANDTVETPANGLVCKVIEFAKDCSITDNVFDGSGASYTFTYDFNPDDPRHYADHNIILPGSLALTNLAYQYVGVVNTIPELQAAWDAISPTYPNNDANSGEGRAKPWGPIWACHKRPPGSLLPI